MKKSYSIQKQNGSNKIDEETEKGRWKIKK